MALIGRKPWALILAALRAKMKIGDGFANQRSGHLQPGFRPEPKIVYTWGLNGPAYKPLRKGGGLRPPPFWKGLEADRDRLDPKYKRFLAPA
jgi:hypothetical protein